LRDDFNNRVFYSQSSSLLKIGSKRKVIEEDIWRLNHENTARGVWESFEPIWDEERKKPKYGPN